MKKIFAGTPHTKFIAAASALTWAIAMANSAGAAQLQEARVTQVVNDVKLLLEQSAARPAAISDLIRHGTAVRTGTQSRSELTFSDLTITRLGANTIFSFKEGTREMTLIDGAILFQVPKGSGGATIRTVGVTAAITGTTGIAEFHPATSSHPQLSKWLCLEGTFHLYLPNGQSVELGPGKIVTADGKSFSKVSTFDIAKLTSTSLFFTGFNQPLASMNLIMLESQNQVAGLLANTTNPLDPTRIVNVTSQAIVAEETPSPSVAPTVSPTVTPPPTPSKFGTPSVISSPVPYRITNGTVITTDPSITTNGVTDYGKIYRGQTDDGPFSLWAFGSTSTFDTALRIDDTFFADPSHLPIAVFKFERLSLTGDPTIDTTNGVSKLGLIGVDGITSGPPGGTLTFTGLDLLLLATVNGSINLTSNVSFQDLHELVMYARGAGSDLTINSPISNIGILGLVAEDSIHLTNPGTMSVGKLQMATGSDLMLQIGGSLLLNGSVRLDAIVLPGASVASGVNLTLNVTGDYTNNSATASSNLTITNRDHIGGDASIAVGATNIFIANNLDVQIDNRVGGHIGENALVNVGVSGGDINIVGDATFQILNNIRGHIGRDANIFVTTGAGGDFTANSVLALVNNHNGGAIGSGANLTFNIGGALVTQGDATFVISNLNEGPAGGTIGSLASLNMNAASISVGGFFQTFVGANGGGSIQGDAINTVNVSGDLTAQQGILVDIQDTGFNQINPTVFIAGGHIGGDATVTLAAQNIATSSTATGVPGIDTMALEASIYSDGSGTIGGNAIVNVLASQNISAPGTVFFGVANDNYQGFGGGTIGGDAQVNVTANNLSTGALFDDIYNNGGASIGRDAIISLNLSNSFNATGNGEFRIFSPGGIITRNASIGVSAGDITAPSLTAEIDNSSAGQIGGNALINFGVSGDVNIAGDASFQILNNAGTIGGDTEIDVNAANISANSLLAQIDNSNGGSIGTGGNISVSTGSDFTSSGDASFAIHNTAGSINNGGNIMLTIDGNVSTGGQLSLLVENYDFSSSPAGHIGTGGNISVTTPGNLTSDSISAVINNQNGGTIGSAVNLTFNIAGALTTVQNGTDYFGDPASLSLTITNRYDNTLGSTIGGDATLGFHADSASIGGNLNTFLSDRGGTIDGNALLNFNVTHDVTVQEDAVWQILNDSGTNMNAASRIGGTIHGTANLLLSAANLTLTAGSLEVDILNQNGGVTGPGGTIDSSANITFNLSGNLTTQTDASFAIRNNYTASGPGGIGGIGGTIGQDAVLNINANSLSIGGTLDTSIHNGRNAGDNGGTIGGNATISLVVVGGISALDDSQFIGNGGGTIGSNAAVIVTAASLTTTDTAPSALNASINNSGGGNIGESASINFDLSSSLTSASDANFTIDNSNGGTVGSDAAINASANSISTTGALTLAVLNNDGGHIGGDASIFVTTGAGGDFTANSTFAFINNRNGGSIGSGANLTFNIGGALTTQANATTGENAGESLALLISNRNDGNGGGTISGDVALTLNAASASIGGNLLAGISTNAGGNIAGSALNNAAIAGDLMTGDAVFDVQNTGFNNTGFLGGGTIGVDAVVNLSAHNILTGGVLDVELDNDGGGHIGRDGLINIISHNINAQGDVLFGIFNDALNGSPAGTIDANAMIDVTVNNISTGGGLSATIDNSSGLGSGFIGATIGGDATVNITAANLTANSLLAQIDNTGGSIGANTEGGAMINMNVSNSATVTNDATVAIYGSDGAVGGAGININGGNYHVGGTFLSYIDGNGTITFNDASAHADVLKAGVFGANGVLNIGGGTLSADSTLKLYAPGSNGQLNFISNVTLGGNSAKILAANSVTIFNNVVVTIGGSKPADVYTGFTNETPNANYTGFGGNDSTTGTFAGAGANDPQPLTNAPPFGSASSAKVTTGGNTTARTKIPSPPRSTVTNGAKVTVDGNVTGRKKVDNVINVRSSDELLSVLDGAAPGPGGKITIPPSKSTNHSKNSSRVDPAGHLNAGSRVNVDRRAMDVRTVSSSVLRHSPQ